MLWRQVCRASRAQTTAALRRTLDNLLMRFLPTSRELLRLVTECHAFLGGEFALSFLLRDPRLQPNSLEVFTSDGWFHTFTDYLKYSPFVSPHLKFRGIGLFIRPHSQIREVRRYASFLARSGREIRVYESDSLSALTPITRSWCTALVNYVTETSFGCAYPQLTLRRLAIVADMCLTGMSIEERQTMDAMLAAGFTFTFHLPEYSGGTRDVEQYAPGLFPCLRAKYVCPDQGRYFGDVASLGAFIDPSTDNHRTAFQQSQAPYGLMAAWRMWTSGACSGGCAMIDDVLNGGAVSLPMVIVEDDIFRLQHVPYKREWGRPALRSAVRPSGGESVLCRSSLPEGHVERR
ncbi:hypothetical protein C8Q76DRAFT_637574 [Earliella scabrosa]|nr:hypothetical protein C8Q76DRAFT_637574 [Earliella scabrosa]